MSNIFCDCMADNAEKGFKYWNENLQKGGCQMKIWNWNYAFDILPEIISALWGNDHSDSSRFWISTYT